MKGIFIAILLSAMAMSFFAGQEIPIVGTGAGMDLLEAVVAEYQKTNPGSDLPVPANIGSGGAITIVAMEKAFLGRISVLPWTTRRRWV